MDKINTVTLVLRKKMQAESIKFYLLQSSQFSVLNRKKKNTAKHKENLDLRKKYLNLKNTDSVVAFLSSQCETCNLCNRNEASKASSLMWD